MTYYDASYVKVTLPDGKTVDKGDYVRYNTELTLAPASDEENRGVFAGASDADYGVLVEKYPVEGEDVNFRSGIKVTLTEGVEAEIDGKTVAGPIDLVVVDNGSIAGLSAVKDGLVVIAQPGNGYVWADKDAKTYNKDTNSWNKAVTLVAATPITVAANNVSVTYEPANGKAQDIVVTEDADSVTVYVLPGNDVIISVEADAKIEFSMGADCDSPEWLLYPPRG